MWGARGGNGYQTTSSCRYGGNGAYTKGTIRLVENTTLYIYIGEHGHDPLLPTSVNNNTIERYGGWNGGGGMSGYNTWGVNQYEVGTGGGSTDIRTANGTITLNTTNYAQVTDENSLRTRVMVASGGGASICRSSYTYAGGYGTTLSTYSLTGDGGTTYSGTQTSGGQGYKGCQGGAYNNGYFGYGGAGGHNGWGGGGGGWYGGGSGSCYGGPGAGGSSYISGHAGAVAVTSLTSNTAKCTTGTVACSESPTGYTFTNT